MERLAEIETRLMEFEAYPESSQGDRVFTASDVRALFDEIERLRHYVEHYRDCPRYTLMARTIDELKCRCGLEQGADVR